MKTDVHLYLVEFFLEWEMLQTKVVQKIKTHTLYSTTLPLKSFHFWDNMEKYGRVRQPTEENTIRRMRTACWITTTTDTYSEYVIFIDFPIQKWLRERASMLRYSTLLVSLQLHVYQCVRNIERSPTDAPGGVSHLQRIPWAVAETSVRSFCMSLFDENL
jgi:hypothetical protein